MRPASSSGGTPMVKERSPRPFRPASPWLSGLVDATQSGGWGPRGRVRGAPPRRHLEIPAAVLEDVGSPRAHDDLERLLPHAARVGGVDAEAFELGAGGRAPRGELEHAVRAGVAAG